MLQFQEIAQKLHKEDSLLHFRDKFHLPQLVLWLNLIF